MKSTKENQKENLQYKDKQMEKEYEQELVKKDSTY